MRIGVMGTGAPNLLRFRGHLLSELAKAGHEPFAIGPGGTPELVAALARLGATYVPIPMARNSVNPLGDLRTAFRLWRLFRDLRLDLLLSYELKAVVYGTLAARLAGVDRRFAMITGRGSTLQGRAQGLRGKLVRGLVKLLYRTALPRTHGVLFQNPDDRAFFAEEGMLPAQVPRALIHGSGVDVDHFAQAPLPGGLVSFLFVGRLLRDKGIREFVEASRLLSERGVPATFRVLGGRDPNPSGISPEELKEWAASGPVVFLGETGDVRPALAQAHVLVLPSYGEGTPHAVLEAMAMGRAIVTTDVPGCRETVQEDRNGFLVPMGDARALAAAMERLALDEDRLRRFAAASRRMAEDKYDVRGVTADILRFMGLAAPVTTPAVEAPSGAAGETPSAPLAAAAAVWPPEATRTTGLEG